MAQSPMLPSKVRHSETAVASTHPQVSVLMPNYNGGSLVGESIQSILDQSFTNWELVICDDGSTDESWEIISGFAEKDPRIRAYQNETNLGNPRNRNRLLDLANPNSEFIAILDSDDLAEPDRIQKQVNFLTENPEIMLCGSALTIINEKGETQGIRKYPETHQQISREVMVFDPFAQPSVMMKHAAFKQVGRYDESLARCQDYDLFTRFLKAGMKTANLSEPLTRFRVHSSQGKYQNIKKAFKYSFFVRSRYLFSKEFFSFKGLFVWFVYLCGYVTSFVLPSKIYAMIFDTLFVKQGSNA